GDEFLLILPGADETQAATIAERARQAIAETPIQTRDEDFTVSISLGYTALGRGHDVTIEEIIARVDEALLTCKREGRNRVRLAG
ncbi:MAG: diguanylate cyclase, partial [Gammaproteobacteria bacterium]